MNIPQQPEPCLGRQGHRTDCDHDGRCYSPWACSAFGFCRVRAVQHKGLLRNGEPPPELRDQWKAEAKQRAEAEQNAYLEKLAANGGIALG
jgi:hypothetical protein